MCNYNGSARDSERLYGSLWRGYTVEYEFQFVALQHSREFEIWRDRENNSDVGRGGQGKMIKTLIKPMIYNKNRLDIAEQIAGGTYKNFDYYVLNIKTHYVARQDMRKEDEGKWQK